MILAAATLCGSLIYDGIEASQAFQQTYKMAQSLPRQYTQRLLTKRECRTTNASLHITEILLLSDNAFSVTYRLTQASEPIYHLFCRI